MSKKLSELKYTLDNQFDELPKDVVYCKNCVVSNQRPRTAFNKDGVCSACQWAYEKDHVIDWKSREKELQDLCDRYRSNDGSFDVVVPGSGGKDSAFVAHQLKHR
ncbi:N-acetyl sugar amidotransferase, partial [Candidatus Woesearchaeota archaeon]|nr:N-acetyl sugar amidotransferase [Candidatus Woesearchaeota archaeon]